MNDDEGDVADDVDNNIFDTVALPDLPVDHDHLAAAAAPSRADPATDAVPEAEAPAVEAGVGAGVEAGVDAGVGVGATDGYGAGEAVAAGGYGEQQVGQGAVPVGIPMPEVMIPAKWLSRYVSPFFLWGLRRCPRSAPLGSGNLRPPGAGWCGL